MKITTIGAATLAAALSIFALPAFAQTTPSNASSGHYEWRSPRQVGPRAPLQAPQRLWVSDAPQVADCACGMMKADAAGCMKAMSGSMPAIG